MLHYEATEDIIRFINSTRSAYREIGLVCQLGHILDSHIYDKGLNTSRIYKELNIEKVKKSMKD